MPEAGRGNVVPPSLPSTPVDERSTVAHSVPAPGRRLLLGVALTAPFMAAFDLFGVNIALPTLHAQLQAGPASLELIVAGYALAYGGGLVLGGRLGDRFGYRRMFLLGLTAFTSASLLCALCATPAQLVAARFLQGLMASIMVPQVFSMITVYVPAERRGRATGWYGAISGLGAIAGQILGGLLVQSDVLGLGWRSIFVVNVPIGVVSVILARKVLPVGTQTTARQFDILGASGSVLAVTAVLLPLAIGRDVGWPWWTWACLAAAIPLGWLVMRWQRALLVRGRSPVINPRLFANQAFVRPLGAAGCYQLYFAGLLFTITLLVQTWFGASALEAALLFLPQGLLFTLSSMLSGRAVARYGYYVLVGGAALAAVGLVVIILTLTCGGPDSTVGLLSAPLALIGLGNGLLLPPVLGAALGSVHPDQAGAASGTLTTVQQFAGALGVTVLGLVFFAIAGPSMAFARSAMVTVCCLNIGLIAALTVLARSRSEASTPPSVTAKEQNSDH